MVLNQSWDAGVHTQASALDIVTRARSFDSWIFSPFATLRASGMVRDIPYETAGSDALRAG
jgi:hypothetical protein